MTESIPKYRAAKNSWLCGIRADEWNRKLHKWIDKIYDVRHANYT